MSKGLIRKRHSSPGVYTSEIDQTSYSRSLGITSLGLVGETLKGPAFQKVDVPSWRDYVETFGGTSPEKFKGSQLPKYELPYIAQSYLKESNRLSVVRVLGLSGVNAGPAWLITASKYNDSNEAEDTEYKNVVIGVLRSRASYKPAALVKSRSGDDCDDTYEFDKLQYHASEVYLEKSTNLGLSGKCEPKFGLSDESAEVSSINNGRFTIVVKDNNCKLHRYPVSLNSGERNFIYNVLGSNATDGETEVFVEELYDVALKQLIEMGEINQIDYVNAPNSLSVRESDCNVIKTTDQGEVEPERMVYIPNVKVIPKYKPVDDLLTKDESTLTRLHVGKRYLYSKSESKNSNNGSPLKVHVSENNGLTWVAQEGQVGHIYTVVAHTTKSGKREYYYGEYVKRIDAGNPKNNEPETEGKLLTEVLGDNKVGFGKKDVTNEAVEVKADNLMYVLQSDDVRPITLDINNYKEGYRNAVTPWFVSELKGDGKNVEMNKLFRLHTISDGDTSNTEVKVSIENIDPVSNTFTVVVRNFFDSDHSIQKLETFANCSMNKAHKNYIGAMIGTLDGAFMQRSKYVVVEVSDNDVISESVPCGALGYPIRDYKGLFVGTGNKTNSLNKPYLRYNRTIDDTQRFNKQYFGMSDLTGIDDDVLRYKGVEAYNGIPRGLTPCFHLDSRLFPGKPNREGIVTSQENEEITQKVSVDGVTGYEWVTVAKNQTTQFGIEPRIGGAEVMLNTIYEDTKFRKFTVLFYGGFDGWDYYRGSRTNTDEYKYNKYRGSLNSVTGYGDNFNIVRNVGNFKLKKTEPALTTDYYAYLAGIREFSNPNETDINIFATPGIDYVHQNLLVGDAIEMVEEERADCLYIITTPDKPSGASDSKSEMFTPEDVIYNLEYSNIDSSYCSTYYPWLKYLDPSGVYINLPQTRDVVRVMASTDNYQYPWIAPTGYNRGITEAVESRRSLTLVETDALYDNRINYVNNMPNDGLRLWGDKNLQIRESAMNRISKRRLLLHLRKLIKNACIGLIFEPNDNTTKKTFENIVGNILNDVMTKRGIVEYKIEVDDSPEARDRLMLPAKIWIKPTLNLEYIDISFVITPQGVQLSK